VPQQSHWEKCQWLFYCLQSWECYNPAKEKHMPDTDKPKNLVVRFFSNPLVGGVGTVIGILLAVYFYSEQREFRKLTYYVHPVKAVVVKAGQASELTAIYADKPIKTDITAAQVALWNQGKLPIKGNDVLKPIVLHTTDKSPILEATIRKVSRDVIKLQLQPHEAQNGRIAISWQILEQNDGGIIQLIYAGSPDVDILFEGVIEGQNKIERIVYPEKIQSPDEQYTVATSGRYFFLFVVIFIVGTFSLVVIKYLKRRRPLIGREEWFVFIILAIMIGLGLYNFFTKKMAAPPFGF
jgi:hypothetical protein